MFGKKRFPKWHDRSMGSMASVLQHFMPGWAKAVPSCTDPWMQSFCALDFAYSIVMHNGIDQKIHSTSDGLCFAVTNDV